MLENLRSTDPEVFSSILDEANRQHSKLELIASENFTSEAVMEAMGTPLTNKYAEGYPGKRYYGGCEHVDVVETLAIERAKKLFNAEHANVQPHSGSGANLASYFALVAPGSKIMGLDLAQGGHLTHGSPVNFSGNLYEFHSYGVSKETEQIDLDEFRKQVEEVKPALVVFGASAYSRTLDFAAMAEIARSVGAKTMADIAHIAGLVAVGLHPSPVEHCDVVTTTTHKTLRGPRGGMILCKEQYKKDINKQIFPGSQGGPLMHVIAAKAVAFHEALKPSFKEYQQRILNNAKAMEEAFKERNIRLIAGGTDTHLLLLDVSHNGLTGKASEHALDSAWLTCNKNMIPYDKEKPFVTSGIRLGTPALTSRGMGVEEMKTVANCIADILESKLDETVIKNVQGKVKELTQAFPLYPQWISLVEQHQAVSA
ncbi:MAG: serine hydroxymethyltransferase [Candidatus Hinthialibacter antarcticus]|nr:serine hydroxymethyltransferase [Candidatus Hinthialibacter antarcticus]